jgi:hypothetical protein
MPFRISFLTLPCAALLPLLCAEVMLAAAPAGGTSVEITHDLLERFTPSLSRTTAECAVRRPASAGGVKQNGLFAHPDGARPGRVEYAFDLPASGPGEALLLAFDIALHDGVKLKPADDGVRFVVEVDGGEIFSRRWRETRWEPCAADLSAFAGRRVTLALVTDPIGNSSYDWSTWGRPRVLRFRGAAIQPSGSELFVEGVPAGVLAARLAPGTRLTWQSTGTNPIKGFGWRPTPDEHSPQTTVWAVRDFAFSNAAGVKLTWEPAEPAPKIWLAAYPARCEVTGLNVSRALPTAGESVPLLVEVKNTGLGALRAGEAQLSLSARGLKGAGTRFPQEPIPPLAPGEIWRFRREWLPAAGEAWLTAVVAQGTNPVTTSRRIDVASPPKAIETLSNEFVRIDFLRQSDGWTAARIFGRHGGDWTPLAVWSPLFRIGADTRSGAPDWQLRPAKFKRARTPLGGQTLTLNGTARDADGVAWTGLLRVTLEAGQGAARIHYEWRAAADRQVRSLLGPNFYVGDGTSGAAKTWGLFPGLEFLYGGERSSNPRDFAPPLDDRRSPHPHKVTVPLMAVTLGPENQSAPEAPGRFFCPDSLKDQPPGGARPATGGTAPAGTLTLALTWDPQQRWDGEHAFPSPRFSSPNRDEGMENHRLALFLPSVPDFTEENQERAARAYSLKANRTLSLDATLLVTPGPATAALREWLRARGGLPAPGAWPRSFQEELDLCREGFLNTVWDAPAERWRHCIGWASGHAPGFAALLWMDSLLAEKPGERARSRARVELAATNMLRDGGPGVFVSQHNCHIMQWEFPFLYGHLPEALAHAEGLVNGLMQSQRPDGGWVYQPANAEQADLGQAGDSVLGTCANRAATLLRWARITGDTNALAAGERALRFMERFRVPRGGQTWECPMYEPDILAAAYAVRAHLDAWRVTRQPRWLHGAVYWAETGVPFQYYWSLPDKPMMPGASIPVFGSTFYTHTWLAVPVQWCGLVYAYHVFALAEELERASLPPSDSPLPLALDFTPADWRRLVELITVSGMEQQFPDGDKAGSYPDSITRFERRNPAFLNPEDLLVNVLALRGQSPDVKTARLARGPGEVVVSSGARVESLQATAAGARFTLRSFAGEPSHTLIGGLKPREIRVNGQPLPRAASPTKREPGWWWDESKQRLYVTAPHAAGTVTVEILEQHPPLAP